MTITASAAFFSGLSTPSAESAASVAPPGLQTGRYLCFAE
uniref:Uncharacterized protein n=1 Tax=Arundo donax TaxID=35708 RepID=A0A0A8YQU7_ARUDO